MCSVGSGRVAGCQGSKYTIHDATTLQTIILTDVPLIDHSGTSCHVGIAHVVEYVSSSLRPSFVVIGRISIPPLSINSSGSAQTELIDSILLEEEFSMRIYVGNLPYSVTSDQLVQLFSPFGEVADVHVVTDRQSGRPKGFAFVEMEDAAAEKAINQLNGSALGERSITVNEAQARPERREGSYRDSDRPRQRRW